MSVSALLRVLGAELYEYSKRALGGLGSAFRTSTTTTIGSEKRLSRTTDSQWTGDLGAKATSDIVQAYIILVQSHLIL